MAGAWWQQPITQRYNPPREYGEDLYEPEHTPITALVAGTVSHVGYYGWGGEVDIATSQVPGHPGSFTEYALHLDQIVVAPGQPIAPGQLLGLSGGQLSGGLHPNDPLYSSGPHVEYGFFRGGRWSGSSIDPHNLIAVGPVASYGGTGGFPDCSGPNFYSPGCPGSTFAAGQPAGGIFATAGDQATAMLGAGIATAGSNTVAAVHSWWDDAFKWLGAEATANIVPLLVGVVLVVLIMGGLGGSSSGSGTKVVPVPV